MHILVVDDDPKLRRYVQRGLEEAGHSCLTAADAVAAMATLREEGECAFDAMLLDVLMPGQDGFELCEELRSLDIDVPIVFVTARRTVQDRIQGLRLGADDYLQKPFSFDELLARLDAVHRRRESIPVLRRGSLTLRLADLVVERGGTAVELSRREFMLLRALVEARGAARSRSELLVSVWGVDFNPGTNVVDVHVANLRRKLARSGPNLIETVKGTGYRFLEEGGS